MKVYSLDEASCTYNGTVSPIESVICLLLAPHVETSINIKVKDQSFDVNSEELLSAFLEDRFVYLDSSIETLYIPRVIFDTKLGYTRKAEIERPKHNKESFVTMILTDPITTLSSKDKWESDVYRLWYEIFQIHDKEVVQTLSVYNKW